MFQNSIPIWVTIILGSGGLIGVSTLIFNVFRQVTDAKDETIRGLKEQIHSLETSHQREIRSIETDYQGRLQRLQQDIDRLKSELSLVKNFRTLLEENLEEIKIKGVTDETNTNVRKIKNLIIKLQDNEEGLTPCRNASHWVRQNQTKWLKEISDAAISKYKNEISDDKEERFRYDISRYLDWLYESLYHGIVFKFREYVASPCICSSFPYRHAFNCLRQQCEFGDLTSSEIEYLQEYLDELMKFLQDQPER